MDYQIASKKLIFTTVILSLLYIVGTFLYRQILASQSVTLCSNGQQVVAVFHLKNNMTILVPTKSLKDTLDCLRKGMSFYDRTIELIVTSRISDTNLNELRSRYTIIDKREFLDNESELPIYFAGGILQIEFRLLYSIYLDKITNPFTFVKFVKYNRPHIVVTPELSEVIARLLHQNLLPNTTQIIDLQEGMSVTLRL